MQWNLDYKIHGAIKTRLQVVPLSLGLSCMTWKKTVQKNGHVKSWGREVRLAPRISRSHFFLAAFFRITHDRLRERGTTCTLNKDTFIILTDLTKDADAFCKIINKWRNCFGNNVKFEKYVAVQSHYSVQQPGEIKVYKWFSSFWTEMNKSN